MGQGGGLFVEVGVGYRGEGVVGVGGWVGVWVGVKGIGVGLCGVVLRRWGEWVG